MNRAELETLWQDLTRITMPALAVARGWPVQNDHCFQRILLDAVCGACWYDRIAKRPAYRHASDDLLRDAVMLARQVIEGTADLAALNRQSLGYRLRR